MRDEKTKDSLTPLIANLLQNKDALNAVLGGLTKKESENSDSAERKEEKTASGEAPAGGGDGKTEAIEKFLNSYFR